MALTRHAPCLAHKYKNAAHTRAAFGKQKNLSVQLMTMVVGFLVMTWVVVLVGLILPRPMAVVMPGHASCVAVVVLVFELMGVAVLVVVTVAVFLVPVLVRMFVFMFVRVGMLVLVLVFAFGHGNAPFT